MGKIFSNTKNRNDFILNRLLEIEVIDKLFICSPFFTNNSFLEHILKKNIKIRLVIRLSPETDCALLRKLINNVNFEIRFFNTRFFHSKIYVFDNKHIIMGSSNFTNNGLNKNMELNVEFDIDFDGFDELLSISLSYWNQSEILTDKVLDELEELFKKKKSNNNNDELSNLISNIKSDIKPRKEFSEKHKIRISQSNKGRKGNILDGDRLIKLNNAARESLSKSVICINSGVIYPSLKEAAIEAYGNDRCSGYISEVCKENKAYYKEDIWRFYDDYKTYTDDEKKKVNQLIQGIKTRKITTRVKTKIMHRNVIYDSEKQFGEFAIMNGFLNKKNSSRPEQLISAFISQSKKLGIPFARLSNKKIYEYFYFAKYNLFFENGEEIKVTPVEKKLEDYVAEYADKLELKISDFTLGDLLYSNIRTFYKIEDKYYKSKIKMNEDYSCDKKINKAACLNLMKSENYKFYEKYTYDMVEESAKNSYYVKNHIIYINKNDCCELYCSKVLKKEILQELGIILQVEE